MEGNLEIVERNHSATGRAPADGSAAEALPVGQCHTAQRRPHNAEGFLGGGCGVNYRAKHAVAMPVNASRCISSCAISEVISGVTLLFKFICASISTA